MSTWFRTTGRGHPVAWSTAEQPAARWHGPDEGPATYLADTPAGAWAEFLRHEEIVDPADLDGIARDLWAVEVPDEIIASASVAPLPDGVQRGGAASHVRCQAAARSLRAQGTVALLAPSGALEPPGAIGQVVGGGAGPSGPERTPRTLVVFDGAEGLIGWCGASTGAPEPSVLEHVRSQR